MNGEIATYDAAIYMDDILPTRLPLYVYWICCLCCCNMSYAYPYTLTLLLALLLFLLWTARGHRPVAGSRAAVGGLPAMPQTGELYKMYKNIGAMSRTITIYLCGQSQRRIDITQEWPQFQGDLCTYCNCQFELFPTLSRLMAVRHVQAAVLFCWSRTPSSWEASAFV